MSIIMPVELYVLQLLVFVMGLFGARWILSEGEETRIYVKRFFIMVLIGCVLIIGFKLLKTQLWG